LLYIFRTYAVKSTKNNGREFEGVALNWGVAPNPLKSEFYLSLCVNLDIFGILVIP
jgi:hypothetical protein